MGALFSPDRKHRLWLLILATLIVLAVGVTHLLQWRDGLRGVELMRFFTMYLAIPLGAGLLLLFAYMRPVQR